jgi:hypothetical protein
MQDRPQEAPRLTDRQRLHWLRLIRTDNVGPAAFRSPNDSQYILVQVRAWHSRIS